MRTDAPTPFDRQVERIAQSAYLTLVSRMATVVGLPLAAFIAAQAYGELRDNTRALIRIQAQIEAMVAVNDDQSARIYRLEGTLLGSRGPAK
ncbi:MAG TPA: hypothetical protein VL966_06850 [Alphaproteobacteria bacterium]|jgi:hypothetical protein|nr:hypothetical protein [Alphaproteobacteria bacterium]